MMKKIHTYLFCLPLILLLVIFSSPSQCEVFKASQPKRTSTPGLVHVLPGPDLVIVSVEGVPDEITALDPNGQCPHFFATITVKNIGNGDAWFPYSTWIIGGPSQYTNISAPGRITNAQTRTRTVIKPRQTWTATLAGKAKCLRGNQVEVRFQVDPQNRVWEKNENNNEWKKLVANSAVPGQEQKPDLVIDSVTFRPPNPTHYDRVMIDVQMRNKGAGPAIFCQSDRTWQVQREGTHNAGGGTGPKVVRAGQQFAGGLYEVEPNTLQKGCYRFFVATDPYNVIQETNENNNRWTAYLSMDRGDCQIFIRQDKIKSMPKVKAPSPTAQQPPAVRR